MKPSVSFSNLFLPVLELIHAFLVKGSHDCVAEGSILGTVVEIGKLIDRLALELLNELLQLVYIFHSLP